MRKGVGLSPTPHNKQMEQPRGNVAGVMSRARCSLAALAAVAEAWDMGEPIQYRPMEPSEQAQVSRLGLSVFEEFVAPLYREQGREIFRSIASPEALLERSQGEHMVLVALEERELVGVIELRDYRRHLVAVRRWAPSRPGHQSGAGAAERCGVQESEAGAASGQRERVAKFGGGVRGDGIPADGYRAGGGWAKVHTAGA